MFLNRCGFQIEKDKGQTPLRWYLSLCKWQCWLPTRLPTWKELEFFVTGSMLELCIAICVVLNTLTMALQRQYEGFDNEYMLNYQGAAPASLVWPG
mmetsp:Transcript_38636/g.124131  ORF Transcript_38636/g.124131 Transcript_38636/m.124131 type:complete len:96 (+) Transcript_38636:223-510(+)